MRGASARWAGPTGNTQPARPQQPDSLVVSDEDNLASARGLTLAVLMSVPLWAGILLGLMR